MNVQPRYFVLDLLRGLAALAVAWFHLTRGYLELPQASPVVLATGDFGWLGVEVFFVVSGFAMCLALHRFPGGYQLRRLPAFLVGRLARIHIPFLVSILLTLALLGVSVMRPGFAGAAPAVTPVQILANATYLAPITGDSWLQPTYWTLAFELAFYGGLALLFPLVGRRAQGAKLLAGTAVSCVLAASGMLHPLFLLFPVGMAAYRFLELKDSLPLTLATMALAAVVLGLRGLPLEACVGLLSALVIIACAGFEQPASLVGSVLARLGAISFSLYLVHVPIGQRVINPLRDLTSGMLDQFALSLAALCLSIVFALVFWRFVERPALEMAQRAKASHFLGAAKS